MAEDSQKRYTTSDVNSIVGGCVVITFAVTLILATVVVDWAWRKDAIRHQVGHYDPESGEFKWNAPVVERVPVK